MAEPTAVPSFSLKIWHEGWNDDHTGFVPDELYQYRTFDSFIPRVEERIKNTLVSKSEEGEINGFVTVMRAI